MILIKRRRRSFCLLFAQVETIALVDLLGAAPVDLLGVVGPDALPPIAEAAGLQQ